MLTALQPLRRLEEFEAAALPLRNVLYRAAVALTHDRTAAEDLVQETFLRAWQLFERYEQGTNCKAWMFQIMFNVCRHQRRKHRRETLEYDWEVLETTVAAAPNVADDLTDAEVLSAFRRVPATYAEIVLLADYQEFSYKEIQEMLAIPIGTVMSRLSRGRQLLRLELARAAAQFGIGKKSGAAMLVAANAA